jgi:hypothetical protein
VELTNARMCHWSAAEPVNLETADNAARNRHPDAAWPTDLPWFDVLERIVRSEPVGVSGAFNFGRESGAKAMHAAGLLKTVWVDGPADGLGAVLFQQNVTVEKLSSLRAFSFHSIQQRSTGHCGPMSSEHAEIGVNPRCARSAF